MSSYRSTYGIFNVKIVFQNTRRIKSFFPYNDKLAPAFPTIQYNILLILPKGWLGLLI